MKLFNCLFFIDDDYLTNYFHEIVAKDLGVAKQLVFFESAEEALAELVNRGANDTPPEIIFLDINMPEINGWEFMDLYQETFEVKRSQIMVLTTSANPADQQKAEEHEWIDGFLSKPLTKEVLTEIQAAFFDTHPSPSSK